MVITRKHLPRRTFLRGAGVTLALPLLDSMIPALSALARTAARPTPRLAVVYVSNGMVMRDWTPTGEGTAYELSRILEPLAPYKDRLLVLSGLSNLEADPRPGEGGGVHSRGPAAFMSGVHIKSTAGPDLMAGITMDQIAARELGKETQLASLEIGLEPIELVGDCDVGFSCAFSSTISWRSPTTPLPMVPDPRAIFERLFGDGDTTDPRARLARIHEDRSMIDSVLQKVGRLQRGLGPSDRTKVAEYLDAIRDVERRIQKAEEQSGQELPVAEKPAGVPQDFEDYYKLMFDLEVLAFQSDVTRVVTYMVSRESSDRVYPASGTSEPHHPMSHHGGDPKKMENQTKISVYQAGMVKYFLDRMQATRDGDGSLLDNTIIMYGGGLSDGNRHSHDNLPVVLVGGGAGRLKGGRHVIYPKDTPMANLSMTLLDKMGVPVERIGDSTGKVEHVFEV
jgi:hypothetical protein